MLVIMPLIGVRQMLNSRGGVDQRDRMAVPVQLRGNGESGFHRRARVR